MTESQGSADRLWGWVVKVGAFGVFVYSTAIRDKSPDFAIALIAIAAAVLPINELRTMIKRRWGTERPEDRVRE